MSEYQYVGFRAIDAPLTDKQLAYMERQSTRAEITRWAFDNEYHYGDFGGNAVEMLRRGYDLHVHYANFGIRTVMIRLPHGLPAGRALCRKYLDGEYVAWKKDPRGPAGILTILSSSDLSDGLWDVHEYLDAMIGVRQQLLDGDLRPLYVAWLCGCQSDYVDPAEAHEPPVPAGLAEPPGAVMALANYFDLDGSLLWAAAERSPPLARREDRQDELADWLDGMKSDTLKDWLLQILVDESAAMRRECLAAFRKARKLPTWPTEKGSRTFQQLQQRAEQLAAAERADEKRRQEKARRRRLANMARSPQKFLQEADQQVAQRSKSNYERAAEILSEIREAVGGDEGDRITRAHAAHLKQQHPTLKMLTGALRRKGLLP